MGNITQGNISFTVNVTESIGGFGTKRTNSSLIQNDKYSTVVKQALIDINSESPAGFSVNAIDIDWNAAELPNSDTTTGGSLTINNSGELLNLVDKMQQEIYVLTAAVIALSNR